MELHDDVGALSLSELGITTEDLTELVQGSVVQTSTRAGLSPASTGRHVVASQIMKTLCRLVMRLRSSAFWSPAKSMWVARMRLAPV